MRLRIGDYFVIACVILLAAVIWLPSFNADRGMYATVSHEGDADIVVSLLTECELDVSGCVICVKDGKISVSESDCLDKVCVKTGEIFREGESVICVPNKVSIRISGEGDFDAIAG